MNKAYRLNTLPYTKGSYLFVGTANEFNAWTNKMFKQSLDIDDEYDGVVSYLMKKGVRYEIMFISSDLVKKKFHKKPQDVIGVIAHEAFHMTMFLLEYRGLKYSEETMEAFTYLHGHIVSEVIDKLKLFSSTNK